MCRRGGTSREASSSGNTVGVIKRTANLVGGWTVNTNKLKEVGDCFSRQAVLHCVRQY